MLPSMRIRETAIIVVIAFLVALILFLMVLFFNEATKGDEPDVKPTTYGRSYIPNCVPAEGDNAVVNGKLSSREE